MLLPADGVSRERVVSLRVVVAVSWLLADLSIHSELATLRLLVAGSWLLADFLIHSELATFMKYGLLAYVSLLRAPTFFGAPNS